MIRNGVSSTGWFAFTYTCIESSMPESQCIGELQLSSEIITGISSSFSRPPKTMPAMLRLSSALEGRTTLPMWILSVSVSRANCMSR